jgi:hypothetical protein
MLTVTVTVTDNLLLRHVHASGGISHTHTRVTSSGGGVLVDVGNHLTEAVWGSVHQYTDVQVRKLLLHVCFITKTFECNKENMMFFVCGLSATELSPFIHHFSRVLS